VALAADAAPTPPSQAPRALSVAAKPWTGDFAPMLDHEQPGEPVVANRGQVQQVIPNLAANAIDALAHIDDRAKMLTIRTRRGDVCTIVSVIDNGDGVDAKIAARIFDAFFTTKSTGTGMGLAICRSLVSAHGGRLWLASDHPRGAAFHFSLPAAAGSERMSDDVAHATTQSVQPSSARALSVGGASLRLIAARPKTVARSSRMICFSLPSQFVKRQHGYARHPLRPRSHAGHPEAARAARGSRERSLV